MLLITVGCQAAVDQAQIQMEAANVVRSDLKPTTRLADVEATVAPPDGWFRRPTQRQTFAAHVQYRSPDQRVRVGVVRLSLPLPLNAEQIVWMAQRGYQSKRGQPKMGERWTDEEGRHWMTGGDDTWDAEGYVVVKGLRGWVVYRAWMKDPPPEERLLDAAARAVRTTVPLLREPSDANLTDRSDGSSEGGPGR